MPEDRREDDEERVRRIREEVMHALRSLENEVGASNKPRVLTDDGEQLWKGSPTLPAGYQITSVDGRIAQKHRGLYDIILVWDDKSRSWKMDCSSRQASTASSPAHLFADGAGKDGLGIHYYCTDEKTRLWVDMPNPPKPPPQGTKLLPNLLGFATGYINDRTHVYQWDREEEDWITVTDVPFGFRSAHETIERLEAISIDDYQSKIYWNGKRKAWIDPRTDEPAIARPLPPSRAAISESDEDLAQVEDNEVYYLWSKDKKRWVMLHELPQGFHRGEDPKEAYEKNGSALDRWIEWDNENESWVDFDSERRLAVRGRIQ